MKSAAHAKLRSSPRRGNRTGPFLAPGCVTRAGYRATRPRPRSPPPRSPVDVGQLHALARSLLHGFRELARPRPVLLVGRGDVQGEQVPERVYGRVDLRAL